MNWYKKAQQLTDEWEDYKNPGEFPILIDYNTGDPPDPAEITLIVNNLIDEYGISPQEINSGNCDTFAEDLVKRIPGSKLYETNLYSPHQTHLFIMVNNLFYDAEHPFGIDDWKKMGIYRQ